MPQPFDDAVVSPELALVDPELAARIRPALRSPVASTRMSVTRAPAPVLVPTSRARSRLAIPALTLLATAAASLVVTAFTGPEPASGDSPTTAAAPRRAAATSDAASTSAPSSFSEPASTQPVEAVDVPTAYGTPVPGVVEPTRAVRSGRPDETPAQAPARSPAPRVQQSATKILWPRSPAASSYDLELVRDGLVIYSARLRSPEVIVPRRWQRDGMAYAIQPEDQAFVWPVVDGRRTARPLVDGALALDMTPVARFAGARSTTP